MLRINIRNSTAIEKRLWLNWLLCIISHTITGLIYLRILVCTWWLLESRCLLGLVEPTLICVIKTSVSPLIISGLYLIRRHLVGHCLSIYQLALLIHIIVLNLLILIIVITCLQIRLTKETLSLHNWLSLYCWR